MCKSSGDHTDGRNDFDKTDCLRLEIPCRGRPRLQKSQTLDLLISDNRRLPSFVASRSTIERDRHTRLEAGWITWQIEAQAQCIAVVTANRTLGLPGRERTQRAQLGDQGWRLLRRARSLHIDDRSNLQIAEQIFAGIE